MHWVLESTPLHVKIQYIPKGISNQVDASSCLSCPFVCCLSDIGSGCPCFSNQDFGCPCCAVYLLHAKYSKFWSVPTWQVIMLPWTFAQLATLGCVTAHSVHFWLISKKSRNYHFAQSPQSISPLQLFHIFGLCIPVLQQFAVAQLQNLNASPRASSHPILLAPC